jgi:hypothetical protein
MANWAAAVSESGVESGVDMACGCAGNKKPLSDLPEGLVDEAIFIF